MHVRVVVITPPGPIVALDDAKAHLRVSHDLENGLITGLVAAAQQHIDGPSGWLGRAVGRQTLELLCSGFPCGQDERLPYPPAASVVQITYDDAAGAAQTLPDTAYALYGDVLALKPGQSWPAVFDKPENVRIRYLAGYETVPAPIVAAVKLMVGDLYRNRDTVAFGQAAKIPMSTTVGALLSPFRVWSL